MSPSKILFGQFIVIICTIVGSTWFATQWAAAELGHQSGLGRPWFVVGELLVYFPWRLYQWWYAYEAYAPGTFNRAGLIAASGGVLAIVVAVAGSMWRSRKVRNVTTYGSAKWANRADIVSAGLLKPSGVFLGQWNSSYLRHNGPEHVMAFAPTRSGKGVGLVIPTLLTWTGSTVIHDIKGENWQLTSGWRATFSKCIRFDPTDPRSPRYNPLLDVRRGETEVRDVQNIADILVDPEGSLERRNHWEKAGNALLVGTILHVLYAEPDKSLAGCARFLSDPSRSFEATLTVMMNTRSVSGNVHPVVAQTARSLLIKSENERSGVLSTALSFLDLYRDPIIAKVTGASDWKIADLVDAANPVSLYLVCPPSDLSRTKPLMRLLLNQIGRRLTESEPKPNRRKLLLMLDEFPALGRLDFFEQTLAFVAGYGIKAYLIAQSLNQIEKAYGPSNSILDNCHVRIAFATNDERTAKRVSEALGTATEQRSQKNFTGHRLSLWLPHMMMSQQETSRPLLTPGEVMQLPSNEELVMVSGVPPLKAQKLRYYLDHNFKDRVLPSASIQGAPLISTSSWTEIQGSSSQRVEERPSNAQDGDREIRPELEPVVEYATVAEMSHVGPETDDGHDLAESQHLETLRKAVAMDQSDPDMIPGF